MSDDQVQTMLDDVNPKADTVHLPAAVTRNMLVQQLTGVAPGDILAHPGETLAADSTEKNLGEVALDAEVVPVTTIEVPVATAPTPVTLPHLSE